MSEADEYDYELPKELIAQQPVPMRSDARMLVVDRSAGSIDHAHIRDLPEYVHAGDQLVVNDSRVVPARMIGRRVSTGGRWQGLFLGVSEDGTWRMLCKTRGRVKPGERVMLVDRDARDVLEIGLLVQLDGGEWVARVETELSPWELLERIGRVPLPPYIRKGEMVDNDLQWYQTVYANEPGSVAAPTAGLHLTKPLLTQLTAQNVGLERVTLHVGIGTFRPMGEGALADHKMHSEAGSLAPDVAQRLNDARDKGGRLIAVGTTSVRVLESAASEGKLQGWDGETNLFIRPPFQFQAVDGLLTNFHLPKSTLLVLVRTFGGDSLISQAYEEAIAERYRFYSYGDAMLIL